MTTRRDEATEELKRTTHLMLELVGGSITISAYDGLWEQLDDLLEIRKLIIKVINTCDHNRPPKPELPPNRIIREDSAKPEGES